MIARLPLSPSFIGTSSIRFGAERGANASRPNASTVPRSGGCLRFASVRMCSSVGGGPSPDERVRVCLLPTRVGPADLLVHVPRPALGVLVDDLPLNRVLVPERVVRWRVVGVIAGLGPRLLSCI